MKLSKLGQSFMSLDSGNGRYWVMGDTCALGVQRGWHVPEPSGRQWAWPGLWRGGGKAASLAMLGKGQGRPPGEVSQC